MLISNMQLEPTLEESVASTESYLMSVCKEYSLDYNTLNENTEIVIEGVIDSVIDAIKAIFKKAVEIIIAIWKAIINFVRKLIQRFINFCKKILGIETKPVEKPIESGYIVIESAQVKDIKAKSKEELTEGFKQSVMTINREIQRVSRNNINYLKSLETRTKANISKDIRESYSPLEEKVVYNTFTRDDAYNKVKDMPLHFRHGKLNGAGSDYLDLDTDDAVYHGHSIADHYAESNLVSLNEEKLKEIQNSKDIVEAYEMYKTCQFKKLMTFIEGVNNRYGGIENVPVAFTVLKRFYLDFNTLVNDNGVDENEVVDFLKEAYFPDFSYAENKEAAIKKWVGLKINYIEGIKSTLTKMLQANYKVFHLSIDEMDAMLKDTKKLNFASFQKLFRDNKNQFMKGIGIVDFRSLGLGVICFSKAMLSDSSRNHQGQIITWMADKDTQTIFNWITRYDAVLMAHGGSEDTREYQSYQNNNIEHQIEEANARVEYWKHEMDRCNEVLAHIADILKWAKAHGAHDKIMQCNDTVRKTNKEKAQISKKLAQAQRDLNTLVEKQKNGPKAAEFTGTKSIWDMESTFSPNGAGPFEYVEEWVRQAIKEGCKKILIMSCNPGHHDLPDDLKKNKHVLIRMGVSSQWI